MVPKYAGDPTGGVSGEGERVQGQNTPGRNGSMAPKNVQMSAMDSPLFKYILYQCPIPQTRPR